MSAQINFQLKNQRGRRPKLYLVLDTETATLPFIDDLCKGNQKIKQKLAIAKPLVYDVGWQIVDRLGRVYSQHSYLIQETFFVPNVFNTAYYCNKRPIYMDRLEKGEIDVIGWEQMVKVLLEDLEEVDFCCAYNAMFDFKKAINFTDEYMKNLYSNHYNNWEKKQKKNCEKILGKSKWENPNEFDNMNFNFRGRDIPMIDLWGVACSVLINEEEYKLKCLETSQISASGLFFKTSAETTFRFLIKDYDFIEEHTALGDTIIETQILTRALKKGGVQQGITYFPFRDLGETVDFIDKNTDKINLSDVEVVIDIMYSKLQEYDRESSFASQLSAKVCRLERVGQRVFKKEISEEFLDCRMMVVENQIRKKNQQIKNLDILGDAYSRVLGELKKLESEYAKLSRQFENHISEEEQV